MELERAIKTTGFKSQKHKAVVNVMFTAYQVKSRVSRILKEFALTPEQFNVLRILKGSHPTPLCIKEIAERMIERNSNVPRIADRLALKKLIKRTPSSEDRRETLLHITPAGIHLLNAASETIESHQSDFVNLTEDQAANLNLLLENLLKE
jgi:DNA-binding MarR family transcriptional regulator